EVVETAGCVEAAESVEVLEVSAFTAEESFEGWAAGVGAAWEEGEESDVLSAGSERAGAGVVDPPGSAAADAASCGHPSEERGGASAGEPSAVAGPWVEKGSAQLGSTLEGSSRHCSRSASTSH